MIARHDDGWQPRQLVEKLPGGGELLRFGPLGEIAAGDNDVGSEPWRDLQQGVGNVLAKGGAEVQIGDVQQSKHEKG